MTDTGPLKKYLQSCEAMRQGQKEKAAALLAESLGAVEATPYMKDAVKDLINPNDAVITILLHESKGGNNGG